MSDDLVSWLVSRDKEYAQDVTKLHDILDMSLMKMQDQSTTIGGMSGSRLTDMSQVHLEASKLRKARDVLYEQEKQVTQYLSKYKFAPAPEGTEERVVEEDNSKLLKLSMEAKRLQFAKQT